MNFFLAACLFIWKIEGVISECPSINDLPVLNESGDEFYCAFSWKDFGSDEAIQGCNGYMDTYMDNYDWGETNGFEPVGSIIVKAGCTFYGYHDNGYTDLHLKYHGPATFPNGCINNDCPIIRNSDYPGGFLSLQCRCEQDPIICQPTDEWATIMQCDNTMSSVETTCAYSKTIGTTWTEETTNSFNIDASIEFSMTESFFGLFEDTLSISATTGYDWSKTSSQAKSETETFQVTVKAPPYTLVQINGAEGNCGGNNVKTELFQTITLDPEGNILSEELEKFEAHPDYSISLESKDRNDTISVY